jgi:hypothetical protein
MNVLAHGGTAGLVAELLLGLLVLLLLGVVWLRERRRRARDERPAQAPMRD